MKIKFVKLNLKIKKMPNNYKIIFLVWSSFCILSCNSFNTSSSVSNDADTSLLSSDNVFTPNNSNDSSLLGKMCFENTSHDFGMMKEGEVVTYDFEFTNCGKRNLIISEAKASCGCTVPTFPQYPIAIGSKEKLKVSFDSKGKTGFNEKKIIIKTNGQPAEYEITILSEVKK